MGKFFASLDLYPWLSDLEHVILVWIIFSECIHSRPLKIFNHDHLGGDLCMHIAQCGLESKSHIIIICPYHFSESINSSLFKFGDHDHL